MNKIRMTSAWLLGIPLIIFGANYFVHAFDLPAGGGSSGERLLESMRDGGLMAAIAASHVLIGVMLLVPRMRFMGALLQLPMSIGITAFHATMLPEGLVVALVMLVLNVFALDITRARLMLADAPRGRG